MRRKMVPRSTLLRLTDPSACVGASANDVVDPRYWIVHSDGFRVDGPAGRVGTVARLIEGRSVIVVRTGLLGGRFTTVPFDDVDGIDPSHQRLHVTHDPRQASVRCADDSDWNTQ